MDKVIWQSLAQDVELQHHFSSLAKIEPWKLLLIYLVKAGKHGLLMSMSLYTCLKIPLLLHCIFKWASTS